MSAGEAGLAAPAGQAACGGFDGLRDVYKRQAHPVAPAVLPDETTRLTVLALGISGEGDLSLCSLLSFQPDLIAVQVAALPPRTVWHTAAGEEMCIRDSCRPCAVSSAANEK